MEYLDLRRAQRLLLLLALACGCCYRPALGKPVAREQGEASSSPAPATDALTPAQRRQTRRLVNAFRGARQSPQSRAEAAQQLLSLGPPGAALLLEAVEGELRGPLERYRAAFTGAAAARIKRLTFDPAEVAALRERIREVSAIPDLTKEMIVQQSEPAVNRLQELLLVDRAEILAGSEALARQRADLAELGQYWQMAQAHLDAPTPEADGAARARMSFEEYLLGEEQLAVQSALPMSDRDRSVLQANARLAASIDPEEARGILALNLLRMLVGLNPLAIDPALCTCARDHANDMRTNNFFSHKSPIPGKESFGDRAALFNTKASAENIAVGPLEGMASLKMWFFSPGHHKNLLGRAQRIGLGRSGNYWTQLFGG